jgi:hypothetical protein
LAAIALPAWFAGAASAQSVIASEDTVVTLTSSANPAVDGSVTFTASVTTSQGTAVPDGHIAFRDMTTLRLLAWTPVSNPSVTIADLSPGQHLIRADYSGTDSFLPLVVQPSQSAPLVETVRAKPEVTLSSSQDDGALGQAVTLTVRVSSKFGTPTGTVTFRDGNSVLAAYVALDARGVASFTTSALCVGAHAVVAEYDGNVDHARAVSQRLGDAVATARSPDGS